MRWTLLAGIPRRPSQVLALRHPPPTASAWRRSAVSICAAGILLTARALVLDAQTQLLPLQDVRAGMRGVGRTVFSGDRIEEFQVEILGVMENAGPKQSLILARLSGGPLAQAGVLQGMSGSPVYIDGKLLGAVAAAFPFSKEPVAGIRPIGEMLAGGHAGPPRDRAPAARWSPDGSHLAALAPPAAELRFGGSSLVEIATPLSFGGFTAAAMEEFAPRLRALGLDPRQGVSAGGRPAPGLGARGRLQPGSMISAQLISGDLNLGADGTVTHIDGDRVYAFGHRFLSSGSTEIPFARSEVMTVLPSLAVSFKISSAREWMGTLTGDYSAAVTGVLGKPASTLPVRIHVNGSHSYDLRLVRERFLSPFLLQMATYAAVDATERATGASTVTVRGEIRFSALPPVAIHNMYSMDAGTLLFASMAGAVPLSYLMQSGFPELLPTAVTLDITASERRRTAHVEGIWPARSKVRPGDTIEMAAELRGESGAATARRLQWRVPAGTPPGTLQLLLCDAMTANLADFGFAAGQPAPTARAALDLLAALRPNHKAYLRVLRPDPVLIAGGRPIHNAPPSVALLLRRWPASPAFAQQSVVAEIPVETGGAVVSGSRAVQIEVVE